MIRKTIYILLFAFVGLGVFAQEQFTEEERIWEERRKAIEAHDDKAQLRALNLGDKNVGSIAVNRDTTRTNVNGVYKTYSEMTPEELVKYVFSKAGSSAVIENVTADIYGWDDVTKQWLVISGPNENARGLGYFNKADSDFPINEGLVISTGDVRSLEGPNASNAGVSGGNPFTGDPDLQGLLSEQLVTNVGILEFDFTPSGTVVEFKYIFGSEEYPAFVGSTYNDVFGFFVNQKGSALKTNIAVLPNGNVVSINTVNAGQYPNYNYVEPPLKPAVNSEYFVKNPRDALSNELNGFTKVLTATFSGMTPCVTYHMKIAVGNVRDALNGSAVFLEANSLVMGTDLTVIGNNIENAQNMYKSCSNNSIRVSNQENTAVTVSLTYGGTLTNGLHYTRNGTNALPASVIVPAKSHIDIPVVISPSAPNGQYFDVTIPPTCPSGAAATARVYVYDNIAPTFSASTQMNPGLNTWNITVTVTNGSGTYEYSINNGATWQDSNVFSNLPAGTYQVKAKDKWSCNQGTVQAVILSHTLPVNPHIMSRYGN